MAMTVAGTRHWRVMESAWCRQCDDVTAGITELEADASAFFLVDEEAGELWESRQDPRPDCGPQTPV